MNLFRKGKSIDFLHCWKKHVAAEKPCHRRPPRAGGVTSYRCHRVSHAASSSVKGKLIKSSEEERGRRVKSLWLTSTQSFYGLDNSVIVSVWMKPLSPSHYGSNLLWCPNHDSPPSDPPPPSMLPSSSPPWHVPPTFGYTTNTQSATISQQQITGGLGRGQTNTAGGSSQWVNRLWPTRLTDNTARVTPEETGSWVRGGKSAQFIITQAQINWITWIPLLVWKCRTSFSTD